MKRSIRRVADLLGAYAHKQGWDLSEIKLYYRADAHWGKIDFIIVTDAFGGRDEYEGYSSVKEYLRQRLEDDPQLFSRIGLVIETSEQVGEGGLYAIGDDYKRVRPRDLIVRTRNEVGQLIVAFASHRNWLEDDFRLLFNPKSASDQLRVVLIWNNPASSINDIRDEISSFLKDRLSDQPDVLYTLDLEVTSAGARRTLDLERWIDSSFQGYLPLSLA